MLADLRFALRTFARARGFATLAVLTLALGVGASTAMFTAVDAALLRPLPYPAPDRLAFVREHDRNADPDQVQSSLRNVAEWRARTRAFREIAAYRYWLFDLAGGPQPEALLGAYVTDNAFAALGVRPALGRTFRPGEDRPGANHVVVLADEFWRRRFGADPRVVGRPIRMDGAAYTVVGVMPPTFEFPATIPGTAALPSRTLDLWVPTGVDPLTEGRSDHNWWTIGRLAPGVTMAQAADELARFGREQHAAHPGASAIVDVRDLRDHVAAPVRPPLLLLAAAVLVLLGIACANIAGLLLARGTGRARELAVRLAVGATRGRLVRSYRALQQARLGFDPARVLTLYAMLPEAKYPTRRAKAAFFTQAAERAAALPGVAAAAAVNTVPLSGLGSNSSVAVEGRPEPKPEDLLGVSTRMVTPTYFRTLGVPLVAGRALARTDTFGAPPVAVVSRALAERLFPGEDAVGHRLTNMRPRPVEIVGVVGDIRDDALDQAPRPAVYLPMAQEADVIGGLVVRAGGGDARALEAGVRRELAALDPEQPVMNVRTMDDSLARAVEARRFGLALTGAFAVAALGLSAVGLYGVLAYLVGLRARELAVRVALGARRADVVRLVVAGALRLVGLGVAVGLAAALGLGRLVAAQLYGVGPADPPPFAAVALVLGGVALAASAGPARRAARVDPAATLRAE